MKHGSVFHGSRWRLAWTAFEISFIDHESMVASEYENDDEHKGCRDMLAEGKVYWLKELHVSPTNQFCGKAVN